MTHEHANSQQCLYEVYASLEIFHSNIKEVEIWVWRVNEPLVCVYTVSHQMLSTN